MKKNNFIQCFLIFSLLLVSNAGCLAQIKDQGMNIKTETSFPIPTPGSVATPTVDMNIVYLSSVPTLTNLQQQLFLLNLNDEGCEFPCYLGILISETTIDEALKILQDFGASLKEGSPLVYDSGLKQYYIQLDIISDGVELRHSIYLLANGKTIIRMHVKIENRHFPYFEDYWSRFFLSEILTQLSDPDYIFISTFSYQPTYTIHVIDEAQGIQYSVISLKNNDLVCPQSDSGIGSIGFTLYDPEYYEEILTVDNWIVFEPQDYKTVNDLLSLSNQEFISQILNESIECFEIPD